MNFKIVIPSARAENLVPCVYAILRAEPALPREHIFVVDDGARAQAEAYLPGVTWIQGIKPFVYARNANLGIRAANADVIVLNDDALLATPNGFSLLAAQMDARPGVGLCSPGVHGIVGNPNQIARVPPSFRGESRMLAFVCVYLARRAVERVGLLDERFTGYGFEDNDYCARLLEAGLDLGIWDGCVVEHAGQLPSTFRTRRDLLALWRQNQRLFQLKRVHANSRAQAKLATSPAQPNISRAPKRGETGTTEHSVDLLYLACNRLEFTRETFSTLLANTDWEYVNELFVMDDGSTDGTREWLKQNIARAPAASRFLETRFGSPVTAMSQFIQLARAPILAKCDNDAMLPRGWLRASLDVLARHPELALLGIEAMYPHDPDMTRPREYAPAQFISGLGLYRRAAFARTRPRAIRKWFGLEEWQVAQGTRVGRGWITPALPVFLLDRIPFDPWKTWSEQYVRRGWQRDWPNYDAAGTLWAWWQTQTQTVATRVSAGNPRFLCAMRVKNEGEHIRQALERALELCARAFVFDDHSTDNTRAICESFGARVVVFPSPFDGLDEARDKNYLLSKVIAENPEWVLWIDGDEVLEQSGPERLRRAAEQDKGVAAYSLRIAYVWDAPGQIRVDGIFGRFRRPSFFPLKHQPVGQLHFAPSGHGGNFHCGNIPRGLAGAVRDLDVRLKHYGYMSPAQRRVKYEWYAAHDPHNASEDEYRHLAEIPGARFAPGPVQIVPWNE